MKLNKKAVKHAKDLIKNGKIVSDSDWTDEQASTGEENEFIEAHDWDAYSLWHLGIHTDENEETKGRFGFPYGDFKRVHRSGVIAAKQRAAQNDYADIEKAADDLLEMIDEHSKEKT